MLPSTVVTGKELPAASDNTALVNGNGYTPASLPNVRSNVQTLPSFPLNGAAGIEYTKIRNVLLLITLATMLWLDVALSVNAIEPLT